MSLRPAYAVVSAAYWVALLGAAMLLIATFYPNPNHDQVGVALEFVAVKPFIGLYVVGFVIGLLRNPRAPRLWAVYLASAMMWWISGGFTGDVIYVNYELACLVLAVFTIICGHVLKHRFEPVRRAVDIPDSPTLDPNAFPDSTISVRKWLV